MRVNFSCKLLFFFFVFPVSDEGSSLSLHMPVGFICAGLGGGSSGTRTFCSGRDLYKSWAPVSPSSSSPKLELLMAAQGSTGGTSTRKERGNILLDVMNIFNFLYGDRVLPSKPALEWFKKQEQFQINQMMGLEPLNFTEKICLLLQSFLSLKEPKRHK